MKNKMIYCLLIVSALLFGMQQQQPAIEQLRGLLANVDKDPNAVATLLWESLSCPEQLSVMLALIRQQGQPQLEHAIAGEILRHSYNIHDILFANITAFLPVSMRSSGIQHLLLFGGARYICAYTNSDDMLCWDIERGVSTACWRQKISNEGYSFSDERDALVYRVKDELVYHKVADGSKKVLKISAHESVYSDAGGRFVLVGPDFRQLDKLTPRDRCYKIFDFERPDHVVILPGIDYHNSMSISADKAFIVVDESRQVGGRVVLVKKLVATASGQVNDIWAQEPRELWRQHTSIFSPTSKYLALGVGSPEMVVFDLTRDIRNPVLKVSCSEGLYKNITFLEHDLCVIERTMPTSGTSVDIIDIKTGESRYSCVVSQCIVAPHRLFVAFMHGYDIALYDVAQQKITRKIQVPVPSDLCALSGNGTFVAVKEKDGEGCLSVYALASGGLMLRVQSACDKCIFHDHEAYLIGMVTDELKENRSMCFWNVATGQSLGTWNAAEQHDICYKDGCPLVMVNYDIPYKSFYITRTQDIIKLDRMLCELTSIEKALQLAIISNRHALVEHTENFLTYVSDEYTKRKLCMRGQYTESMLAALDRLVAYDACLKWLESLPKEHIADEGLQNPAKKRAKKERDIFNHDPLEVDCKKIKFGRVKSEFLASRSLSEHIKKFSCFCAQLERLSVLPADDQKEITAKLCRTTIYKYIQLLKDELRVNPNCLEEGAWQYQVFRLVLIWLPALEKNLIESMKAYNRERVIRYYNAVLPGDGSIYSVVAQKIRGFIMCLQGGTESQIDHARHDVENAYMRAVGAEFEFDKILPFLNMNIRKYILDLYGLYQKRRALLSGDFVRPADVVLERLMREANMFVQHQQFHINVLPLWIAEQTDKIRTVAAMDDVAKLDKAQAANLVFYSAIKDFIDYYLGYSSTAPIV
jgi:hypothetical protein